MSAVCPQEVCPGGAGGCQDLPERGGRTDCCEGAETTEKLEWTKTEVPSFPTNDGLLFVRFLTLPTPPERGGN